MQKGCCYDDSFDDGQTPWCFYPPGKLKEWLMIIFCPVLNLLKQYKTSYNTEAVLDQ